MENLQAIAKVSRLFAAVAVIFSVLTVSACDPGSPLLIQNESANYVEIVLESDGGGVQTFAGEPATTAWAIPPTEIRTPPATVHVLSGDCRVIWSARFESGRLAITETTASFVELPDEVPSAGVVLAEGRCEWP